MSKETLKKAMVEYQRLYHEIAKLPEFKDLVAITHGKGFTFQAHESERAYFVKKAVSAGESLKEKIFDRISMQYPELVAQVLNPTPEDKEFRYSDMECHEIWFKLICHYLPSTEYWTT